MARATVFSDIEEPGTEELVESLIRRETPTCPIYAIFWKSAFVPTGVISNLKSPVSTIRPFGVLINTPRASGIECTTLKKPIEKCLVLILDSELISVILHTRVKRCSSNFFSINAFAKRGA